MRRLSVMIIGGLLTSGVAMADQRPIAGTVRSVDVAAQTLTVDATMRGRTRQVVIHVTSESKIVRVVRATEKAGFVEQALKLADLKPGWTVTVTTRHRGADEVAEVVKVLVEP